MLDVPNNRKFLPENPWTEDRVEQLRKLWADGDSCSQIAATLNCGFTRNAVIGKISRLGLSGRVKIAKPRSKVAHDRDRGTKQRIAKMVKLRSPSHGGAVIVDSVVREPDPDLEEFNAAIPVEQRRTLMELTSTTCRFPCGDVGPDLFFCGAETEVEIPYCGFHSRIAYRIPPPRVERAYLPTGGTKPAVF